MIRHGHLSDVGGSKHVGVDLFGRAKPFVSILINLTTGVLCLKIALFVRQRVTKIGLLIGVDSDDDVGEVIADLGNLLNSWFVAWSRKVGAGHLLIKTVGSVAVESLHTPENLFRSEIDRLSADIFEYATFARTWSGVGLAIDFSRCVDEPVVAIITKFNAAMVKGAQKFELQEYFLGSSGVITSCDVRVEELCVVTPPDAFGACGVIMITYLGKFKAHGHMAWVDALERIKMDYLECIEKLLIDVSQTMAGCAASVDDSNFLSGGCSELDLLQVVSE